MPHYYFDYVSPEGVTTDEIGMPADNDVMARDLALLAVPDFTRDLLPYRGPEGQIAIRVRDENGREVLELRMSYAVVRLDTDQL